MPELFELAEVVRDFEQNSIHLMARCVAEGTLTTMSPGARRHEAIVKRFEKFLEENVNTSLSLAENCAAVGAAERTLRAACEDHVGMGPIRYLALRRMHLVRRALLRTDSSTATVISALFGESPSVTLQRRPERRDNKPIVPRL
jgi:methylphosphotriester-DNA--protein-cysteine methyltransferase